jgi:hypothetical protein
VRILFERGGFCRVSLLPERTASLPEIIDVDGSLGSLRLTAMQEEFYHDIVADSIGHALQTGIELQQTGARAGRARWSLSGRPLFVLQQGPVRGFVSAPRLVIGNEEQLVLCKAELSRDVEQLLAEISGGSKTVLDETLGAPTGWIVIRGVQPSRTLPITDEGSILNVLRPQPDIEVVLDGGIRLNRSEWLAGFPPKIHIRGSFDGEVTIDGNAVNTSELNRLTTQDRDAVGQHVIWCAGVSRSYSIVEPEEGWELWPAYTVRQSATTRAAICGPSVIDDASCEIREILWVPVRAPVVLGARPGDIVRSDPHREIRTEMWPVATPFAPVWAMPANPLQAPKASSHVLLIGRNIEPETLRNDSTYSGTQVHLIRTWVAAILNAARKGLTVSPASREVTELWLRYIKVAKRIGKRLR